VQRQRRHGLQDVEAKLPKPNRRRRKAAAKGGLRRTRKPERDVAWNVQSSHTALTLPIFLLSGIEQEAKNSRWFLQGWKEEDSPYH